MASNYFVTIYQPGETPKELLRPSPILSKLYIITETNSNIDLDKAKYPLSQLKNSDQLCEIIQRAGADSYLEAIPSVVGESRLQFFPLNRVTLVDQNLKIYLDEDSYKSIPNLSNIGVVKKLKYSKIGHGAKNYVSYPYSISFKTLSGIKPEVKFVLQTIFKQCDIITNIKIESHVLYPISKSQPLNEKLNLSPIFSPVSEIDDLFEFYEYLVLLNLNSSQLLIESDIDDYISSYQVPGSANCRQTSLELNSYNHISGNYLLDLIEENWLLINAYSSSGHLLAFKSPIDQSIITWNIYKSQK